MHAQNLINIISDQLPSLNKSESKVARVILADPDRATSSSIAALAKAAGVSEPSVNRFCKRFNASGFPDFKLRLAKALVSGVRFVNRNVEPDDDVVSYTPKIFDSTINNLAMVRDRISHNLVNQVVDKLIQAKRIYFFGLGASGSVARDAENKFFRFNLPVSFHDDVLMQRMLASTGSTGDVFFFISHTGRTKEVVEVAEIARNNGANTLAGAVGTDQVGERRFKGIIACHQHVIIGIGNFRRVFTMIFAVMICNAFCQMRKLLCGFINRHFGGVIWMIACHN